MTITRGGAALRRVASRPSRRSCGAVRAPIDTTPSHSLTPAARHHECFHEREREGGREGGSRSSLAPCSPRAREQAELSPVPVSPRPSRSSKTRAAAARLAPPRSASLSAREAVRALPRRCSVFARAEDEYARVVAGRSDKGKGASPATAAAAKERQMARRTDCPLACRQGHRRLHGQGDDGRPPPTRGE